MKFAKLPYQKLAKLNLWLHAALAIASVIFLFALPIFPTANGSSTGFKWLCGLGAVLIFGIGDGYPPLGMKITGGIILALLASVTLSILLLNFCFFVRLAVERTTSWRIRTCLCAGAVSILALSFFVTWVSNCEEIASNAIMTGNIKSYEQAARWRHKVDINGDLYSAARWGQLRMVEYLLSKGADPNAKMGGNGESILAGAIPNVLKRTDGNTPVIEYLKSHGATN
jgi:hypothetical protein